ncbi:GNAT family N-acetyltransferase [Actinomadura sp. NPDC047616]|uniref:GNAT family N-acetyltransferase n=1 Tax=Actinomadura sp. NPDC047616 TaxID=3155914 RepID=UPI00340F1E68
MDSRVSVRVGGRDLAVACHDAIRTLHDDVFLRPPFEYAPTAPQDHDATLREIREDPTFGIAVAGTGPDDLVGFAYGHRLPPDHRWWTRFPEPLPDDIVAEWEGRTFALIDLAVAARWRRRGIGRRLVETLLTSRDEERAVLSVQPSASAAHALYEETGWRLVGRKGPIPGVIPPYWDIYLRPLGAVCGRQR